MIFKRIAIMLFVVCLGITFTACKDTETTSEITTPHTESGSSVKPYMTLLYSAADTFNPYTAKTDINRQLCRLLYEPLVKLDNSFSPVYALADDVKTEGTVCTAVLKSANFSDGSRVTADDVVYSFNLAKESASYYGAKLYECTSAVAKDSKTVVFTLTKTDPYFVNLLDFPILKSGSDKITDSDSQSLPPIGSGRYKVNAEYNGFVLNESYASKDTPIKEIKLINAPDNESVAHYVELGAADMYYSDISDGTILRMSGQKMDINLNNLVYIGVNQNYGALINKEIRQAISAAIDRTKISIDAFYNNALPATGFFNPVWKETKSLQNIQIKANSKIAIENLEKIGYNILDKNSIRVNSNGTPLKFTLLVNSENRMRAAAAYSIAEQLSGCGIKIDVIEKNYASYLESLKNGEFQLYLGEVKFTENMDVSSLVLENGSAAFGYPKMALEDETGDTTVSSETSTEETEQVTETQPASISTVVNGFYSGVNTIADIATVLQTEMPAIPICYRTGVLFLNENIENVNNSSASDIYFSIESYIYNN